MLKNTLVLLGAALVISAAHAGGNPAAGKEKSAACVACHGADGNSQVLDFPRLAGQYEDYLATSLAHYKSGKRKNAIMADSKGLWLLPLAWRCMEKCDTPGTMYSTGSSIEMIFR